MKKVYKIILFALVGLIFIAGFGGLYYAWATDQKEAGKKIDDEIAYSAIQHKETFVPVNELPIFGDVVAAENQATTTNDSQDASSQLAIPESSQPIATLSNKLIEVSLAEQKLTYYENGQEVGSFLISSGVKWMPTPAGTFQVQAKRPVVLYAGPGYYLPNTKWNLQFLPHYYIHGAYWHNNFGHPMSHGCVNVSYQNMEGFYNWADVGTQIIIQ